MEQATHRFLLSQRAAVSELIERAPEGSVITRSGLERRLSEIDTQLEPYEGVSPHVMRARLMFRGGPVVGDYGIWADFCGDAVPQFARALSFVGASQGNPLSSTGPVPRSDDFKILITGVVHGSFGFDIPRGIGPVNDVWRVHSCRGGRRKDQADSSGVSGE